MLVNSKIKSIYKDIQNDLFQMIPEKWDKICLYASVIDDFNNTNQNEMFFYYFPSGILKKNPVNVYEISNRFNIDEASYLKKVDVLYSHIKKLKQENIGKKQWTNITIVIHNFKFHIEYNYDDLVNSRYTSYERHVIWRYIYLGIDFEKSTRKEKEILKEYLTNNPYYINIETEHYEEAMYKKPKNNLIQHDKQVYLKEDEPKQYIDAQLENNEEIKNESNIKTQILSLKN